MERETRVETRARKYLNAERSEQLFRFSDGKFWEALERYRRRRDSVGSIFKATAGTSTHRRAPFIVSPSRSRAHHPFFPFEYLHITSLGYAHLLLIVCNLLDLRVYPFTHLRRALKGTLCHGVHNAFFLPSALAPLFQPHTFTHSHMHTDTHTTHTRIHASRTYQMPFLLRMHSPYTDIRRRAGVFALLL